MPDDKKICPMCQAHEEKCKQLVEKDAVLSFRLMAASDKAGTLRSEVETLKDKVKDLEARCFRYSVELGKVKANGR